MAVDVKPDPQALGENPLIEGLERLPVPATTLTIFGATGDLAHRKLLPALYNLAHEGALPERFNLIGISRREMPDEEFREVMRDAIVKYSRRETDPTVLEGLLGRARYVGLSFDDTPGYAKLKQVIEQLDEEGGGKLNRAFYLSTAPEYFPVIVQALKDSDLNYDADVDVRCIIEKPFGTDLESAQELQRVVEHVFREQQVYRIDHYLGKETVQNVMAFRFANFMFEPVWNRNYIENIQITAAEDIGIGTRAGYYDQAGAMRDLVQNHMLQLLTLVCMEPPASFEADKVRDEKVKVLQAITPPTPEEVRQCTVRAQYAAGHRGRRGRRQLPRRGRRARRLAHGDVRGAQARGPQLALGRRPDLPAHGQAAHAQGHRDRGPAQAGPAPGVPVARVRRREAQPARADDAAQRGRVAVAGGEDPRFEHADPAGEHGVPVRLRVHVAVAGGLRAAHPRRHARRGHALHPQRRGDRAVVDHRPDPEGVGG